MFDSFDISDIMAFMLFLMDSLHEDCNRVKDKPKVELPDTEDRPVEVSVGWGVVGLASVWAGGWWD